MTQHSLTQDPWTVADGPEFGWIPVSPLSHIDRAADAMQAIARVVGNCVRDTDTADKQSLDDWTVAALMGGVESLCEHVSALVDQMMSSVESHAQEPRRPCPWRRVLASAKTGIQTGATRGA